MMMKYSVLEATKQIFVWRSDSSIDLYQQVKNDNYHLGQLFWPVSQIDIQRIMLGFLVEGHIYQFIPLCTSNSITEKYIGKM